MNIDIESIILSYLENSITKADLKRLDRWLAEDPSHREVFEEYQNVWFVSETVNKVTGDVLANEWINLKDKFESNDSESKISKKQKIVWWHQLSKIAAIFIAGAFVSWAAMQYINVEQIKSMKTTEIVAPFGAKSLVNLPDGSKVWINAGSKINYAANFGVKNREIFLEGEAFFDVAKDKSKLFLVKTTDVIVKAYGTSFNVKSYAEEKTIEATLVEGEIGITRNSLRKRGIDEVILKPNQRVIFYKKTATFKSENTTARQKPEVKVSAKKLKYVISKGINPQIFTSWKEDRLMINSETLGSLAIKLERKYDIKIHFGNEELKKIKFTGTIEKETIEQVLNAIKLASSISYKINESDIWLSQAKK